MGYENFVDTDHSVIRFLMNKPITIGRITRWSLLLHEFNITVIDKPGRDNSAVDFLSQLNIERDIARVPIPDDFPDDNFFSITTHTPWFVDVANYLESGRLP